jgi:hypothetical protein
MFSILTIILAVAVMLPGTLALLVAPKHPEFCRRIPRNRNVGVILALGALLWAAHEAEVMLEGGLARFIPLLNILAPIIAFLAYFFLTYLATRAFCGLLLLLITRLLHEAFVIHLPARPVFSALCYIIALAAMVLIAQPWMLRDIFEKSAKSKRFRTITAIVGGASALAFTVFAVIGLS